MRAIPRDELIELILDGLRHEAIVRVDANYIPWPRVDVGGSGDMLDVLRAQDKQRRLTLDDAIADVTPAGTEGAYNHEDHTVWFRRCPGRPRGTEGS